MKNNKENYSAFYIKNHISESVLIPYKFIINVYKDKILLTRNVEVLSQTLERILYCEYDSKKVFIKKIKLPKKLVEKVENELKKEDRDIEIKNSINNNYKFLRKWTKNLRYKDEI